MAQKWYQSVGVRAALIVTIGGIIVASMNILHERSQLKRDVTDKDTRIAELTDQLSSIRSEVQRLETQLAPFKIIALEKYTGSEQETLRKLADEIQELKDPLKKLIASATSRVVVTIKSDAQAQGSASYTGAGGHLMFVKDRQSLLATAGTQSNARWNGKGEATYEGDFSIAPGASSGVGDFAGQPSN